VERKKIMKVWRETVRLVLPLQILAVLASPAVPSEKVRNERVAAVETTLPPGGAESSPDKPGLIVCMKGGTLELVPAGGKPEKLAVNSGDVRYLPPQTRIKNTGSAPLQFARIDFLGSGSPETLGVAGLSPNYKLLFENRYTRTYDIRIPAHTNEPQHTHKDRVVVCLSGAYLKHLLPDGREEPSTLKTGEILWRRGGTHIGQNLGNTDLWVIAIEPK
jgi:hypothetical protein